MVFAISGGRRSCRNCTVILLILAVILGLGPAAPPISAQDPSPPGSAGATSPNPTTEEFVPDEILVRFRPSVAKQQAEKLVAERGLTEKRRIKALDVQVLKLPPGLSVERAVDVFSRLPEVAFAEPNYIIRIALISDPGLDKNQWAPQKIGAPQAWLSTEGDPSVVIAIVNTGVDYRHSELAPNMWVNPNNSNNEHGWNFVSNNADTIDDNSHGTHVAGSCPFRRGNARDICALLEGLNIASMEPRPFRRGNRTAMLY